MHLRIHSQSHEKVELCYSIRSPEINITVHIDYRFHLIKNDECYLCLIQLGLIGET